MARQNKQEAIYEFIKEQLREKGYPPSVREICNAVELRSTSTVHGHLKRLEEKGVIRRDPTKPRAIEVLEHSIMKKEMVDIPVVGTVTAGKPILAVENIEDTFALPINYVRNKKQLFALKIKGDSMIDTGILDGDLAIVEKNNSVLNGEIVVALLGDRATVKRFFKEKDYIRLQPENETMEPIIVKQCEIIGKVVGVYRKY
ncbi:LexA repressor [Clostridium tetani]|uniref:LexA repressor n=1 Tax=Clostridium tetani (strain Massachusetts / E88) TaxID=212717 RepID=LEXA_CLOTE|nr:transcriptional repressor LexA [Clostridium tetani]Q895H6.1 RecName: Full=LexA repressor [Clostridium tetani E88]AAO35864.1 lexA repressor [Clostridium tetani E88]KGI38229.1 LexA family transcriptional regulator [Clostridium tetani]KGI40105.1 LexA family transcriptional regulator [Clostridium tetani ATCC 9441]KGI42677.1 LexA family transcriptional regulator [Clostridium tetani]KHO33384.1 LexA family transcriptional regulator [Clostridium tetani]